MIIGDIGMCGWCESPYLIMSKHHIFCHPNCSNKYLWWTGREKRMKAKKAYNNSDQGKAVIKAYRERNKKNKKDYDKKRNKKQRILKETREEFVKRMLKKGEEMKNKINNKLPEKVFETVKISNKDEVMSVLDTQLPLLRNKVATCVYEVGGLKTSFTNRYNTVKDRCKELEFDVATLQNQVIAINKVLDIKLKKVKK